MPGIEATGYRTVVKPSFVTWQLRRLHTELDAIDQESGSDFVPAADSTVPFPRPIVHERVVRRAYLERMLRTLPKRLGFRSARAFIEAVERAHHFTPGDTSARRRLSDTQVRELERRVLNNERPKDIARAIGCAEQTVLNRASQFRKRLAGMGEQDASGI